MGDAGVGAGEVAERLLRKPDWLRVRLASGPVCARVSGVLRAHGLHTVCEEALCPNQGGCWSHGTATFLILGSACTRACRFCNVDSRVPAAPDWSEPGRVAEAVRELGLNEVVLTSVTRDDLADGGAGLWAATIRAVRAAAPAALIEALVPDWGGRAASLEEVVASGPDVLAHNLETVRALSPVVRPQADYERSLALLRQSGRAGIVVKSGIMVGLGETEEQVVDCLTDAREAGCGIFTIGQYLRPTRRHLPVERYVEPEEFERYAVRGRALGLGVVLSGPLVRSSLHSDEQTAYVRRMVGRAGGGGLGLGGGKGGSVDVVAEGANGR